jgi:carotenoid cleavage dioxygenase
VIDAERTDRFPGIPKLHRWDVDLKRGVVTEHPFEGRIAGFPRVDERRTGKPYRYAYVVEFEMGPLGPSGSHLRRYDVEARTSVAKDFGRRYAVAECVFAPSGRSAEEDDGWLLFFRYDTEQDRSDLVVLDARDFGGEPVAVVALPRRVPMGIHGSWVPDAALAAPR